jgi:translation initiation factor 2B subunit (eIF-2B alpha/beta/delta family)
MRSIIFVGLFSLAMSANAADKPVVVAAMNVKEAAATSVRSAAVSVAAAKATREAAIPEGSLEKFGSVGLPQ